MMYNIKVFLLSFFCFGVLNAQVENNDKSSEVDEILDDLFLEDEEVENNSEEDLLLLLLEEEKELDQLISGGTKFKFLYFSVDYNSDTYFSGRDIGIDQYNLRPQITYMNSKGFYSSISGIYYSQFDPNWDFTSVSLGYGKSIGKKKQIRLTANYSRYFYSQGVENPFKNAIGLGVGIKNKKRNLGTRLSLTTSFGDETSYQLSSTNFARFKIFKNKTTSLYFRPMINITMGNQIYFRESGTVLIDNEEFVDYEEIDTFSLINTQINFPLQLNYKDFDFELGYNYNVPHNISQSSFTYKNTGFFNFSVGYLLDF